ncbi:MAG: SAM-dependent methyltransferase [Pseudomonadota bacterium]
MSFSADWLTRRADADRRARNADLANRLAGHFADASGMRILDLGAGHGSNMRLTSPHLPAGQRWMLMDADEDLLARASAPEGVSFETGLIDLANDLTPVLNRGWDLVTASALFDLCGADWLDRFVASLAAARLPLYAVLSYDGREDWSPPHVDDAAVLAAFHADQTTDKGLGQSLGPRAHSYLVNGLRAAGYDVAEGRSDWDLTVPTDADLIADLATGTGGVAANAGWVAARQRANRVVIGHMDLFAIPR